MKGTNVECVSEPRTRHGHVEMNVTVLDAFRLMTMAVKERRMPVSVCWGALQIDVCLFHCLCGGGKHIQGEQIQ